MRTKDAMSHKARFERHKSLPVCVDGDVQHAIDVNAKLPVAGSKLGKRIQLAPRFTPINILVIGSTNLAQVLKDLNHELILLLNLT
ncbi:hypothetical protein V6N13_088488 [Hibiscus sabdariffa]